MVRLYPIPIPAGNSLRICLAFILTLLIGATLSAQPVISSISPTSARMSQVVFINGQNFTGVKAVSFGGTPAQVFTVVSDKLIYAWLGNGATGNVSVTTGAGTATLPGFTFLDGPKLLSFTPASGTEGSVINITGLNFYASNGAGLVRKVTVGGTPVSAFYYKGDNTLELWLGSGASGYIAVTTDKGTDSIPGFIFNPPIAYINDFSPKVAGKGQKVTIAGYHLNWVKGVSFGGVPADSFTIVNNDTLIATVGAGASGALTLTTDAGPNSVPGFTWIKKPPVITGVTPAAAPAGTTVTITGANFSPVPGNNFVFFGTAKAAVTAATATSLTVTVPVGATYQPISVTSDKVTGYSSQPFNVIFSGGSISDSAFSPRLNFAMGGHVLGANVLLTDLDGDQRLDIAMTDRTGPDKITMLRNTSSQGNLSFTDKILQPSGATPSRIASEDLDGDGTRDLTIVNESDLKGIFLYRNRSAIGQIALDPYVMTSTVSLPEYDHFITDLNQDGKPDIALLSFYGKLSVYQNKSAYDTIFFNDPLHYGLGLKGANSITAADLDGDGRQDLVISFITSVISDVNKISIRRNTSTAGVLSFAPPVDLLTDAAPSRVGIADLDKDGKPEIITGTYAQTLGVYRNNSSIGNMSFGPAVYYPAAVGPAGIAVGDLDGDGDPDIAATSPVGKTVSVFSNTSAFGSISLAPRVDYATGANPQDVAIGDLNGDGKQDICVSYAADSISVFINKTGDTSLPLIASFLPARAKSGDTITIRGSRFNGTTAVSAGGAAVTSFTVMADSVITAVIGNGGTGIIGVTTPAGIATADGFTFIPPAPSIDGFTPSLARAGDTVTITGMHFTDATAVSFGAVPAAFFKVTSSTTIAAVPGAGSTGSVSVTTAGGMDSLPGFTFLLPPPDITAFSPDSVAAGAQVVIKGRYFNGATAVSFGNTAAASYIVNTDSTITAVVGNGASGAVYVTTPYGTDSLPGFSYIPPLSVTKVTPSYGGEGRTVVITGTRFTGATAVYTSGVPAMAFKVISDTELQVIVGELGNDADSTIRIVTPVGTVVYNGFDYITMPVVTAFTPAFGSPGTVVTITGANFIQGPDYTKVTAVKFGEVPAASFTIVAADTIKAVVGNGKSGAVTVWSLGGVGGQEGFVFVPAAAPPVLTSFSPTAAKANATITITGKYLSGTTAVSFGNVPALSFRIISDSGLTAVAGQGESGPVKVTTVLGTASRDGFVYIPPTPPAPAVYYFIPASGPAGAAVTIHGQYLGGVTAVSFGGVPAASFTVSSDTIIRAIVGNGASGAVRVTSANGSAASGNFNYVPPPPPPPAMSSFSPASGSQGTVITIRGQYLAGATAVTFGGVAAASFETRGDTIIYATLGTGASGTVRVVTPDGIAMRGGFTYTAAVPAITSFSPVSGGTGARITIRGQHLGSVTTVTFGGVPAAQFSIVSDSVLNAYVNLGGATGNVTVASSGGSASLPGFTFIPPVQPPPFIGRFAPAAGDSGTVVMIEGRYFTDVINVTFGGVPATSFSILSDTTMSATVGAGATGALGLITARDTVTLPGFTYLMSGIITPVTPPFAGSMVMYPNPASGYTWVEHPVAANGAQLKITDMMGNLIKIVKVAAGVSKTQVDLSGINTGYYRMVWSDGTNTMSKAMMIVQ